MMKIKLNLRILQNVPDFIRMYSKDFGIQIYNFQNYFNINDDCIVLYVCTSFLDSVQVYTLECIIVHFKRMSKRFQINLVSILIPNIALLVAFSRTLRSRLIGGTTRACKRPV